MKKLIVLCTVLLLSHVSIALADTYYVTYANDSYYYDIDSWGTPEQNIGSSDTLEGLIHALSGNGHTIVLAGGIYTDLTDSAETDSAEIVWDSFTLRSAIPSDPLYEKYGGKVVIRPAAGIHTEAIFLKSAGVHDVTLEGLTIVGGDDRAGLKIAGVNNVNITLCNIYGGQHNGAIVVAEYVDDVTTQLHITGCVLFNRGVTTAALNIRNTEDQPGNVVSNCILRNDPEYMPLASSSYGIILFNSNGWKVLDNVIGDEHARFNDGILLSTAHRNYIANNRIRYCWNGEDYPNGSGTGIVFYNTSAENTILANTISYCNRGINITTVNSPGNNLIAYNYVEHSAVNGIDHNGNNTASDYIVNNTVIHTPTGSAGHGICLQNDGVMAVFINNLVYAKTTHPRPHNIEAISISDDADPDEYSVSLAYNLYYLEGTSYLGQDDDLNKYDTLSDWKAALDDDPNISGKESGSIQADPLMLNQCLAYNSPAKNAGTFLIGVHDAKDIFDYKHNRTLAQPDIGACGYKPQTFAGGGGVGVPQDLSYSVGW